jgi:hypothetical protein
METASVVVRFKRGPWFPHSQQRRSSKTLTVVCSASRPVTAETEKNCHVFSSLEALPLLSFGRIQKRKAAYGCHL